MSYWYTNAAKLLATTLFAATHSGRTMADVLRWIDNQDQREIHAAIDASDNDLARHAWQATQGREQKVSSSIYTTAETALAGFADQQILQSTTHANLNASQLLDGGAHTLYLVAPVDRQDQLRAPFTALIESIRDQAYARGATSPLSPALLFLFDELANISPIPDLDKLASTASAQGIQILTAVQDLAQLHTRYGKAADTIINNHKAKLILPGTADPATLEWAARITGDEEIRQSSSTAHTGTRDSTTQSTTWRPLAPPHLVRQQAPGQGLLIYGHLPATTIELRPWFREDAFQRRTSAATRQVQRCELRQRQ